ncbi:MAG: DUF3852 family protein [Ruminococcus sp.]|nr:DUF3852 family protein [Ruminococcus sp.]
MNKRLNLKSKSLIIFIISILMIASTVITTCAAVDLAGGITQIANQVKTQGKTVAAVIFGVIAVGALIFTIAKGIRAAIAYNNNQDYKITPVVVAGIGTIVAGLCSTSAFFGWFGF